MSLIDTSKMTPEELDIFRMKDRMVSILQARGVSADVEDSFARLIELGSEIGWGIAQSHILADIGVKKEDTWEVLQQMFSETHPEIQSSFRLLRTGVGVGTNVTAPTINCPAATNPHIRISSPEGTVIRGAIFEVRISAVNTALATLANARHRAVVLQAAPLAANGQMSNNYTTSADTVNTGGWECFSVVRHHLAPAAGSAQMRGIFTPTITRNGSAPHEVNIVFSAVALSSAVNNLAGQNGVNQSTFSWQGIAPDPIVYFTES